MRDWLRHCLFNWRWWLVFPVVMANVPLVLIQMTAKGAIPVMEFVDDALEWLSGYTLKPFIRYWRDNKEKPHD